MSLLLAALLVFPEFWAQDRSEDLRQAGVAELRKDFRTALRTYAKYRRDNEVGEEATLGELRCLTALKEWTPLKTRAEELVRESQAKKNFSSRVLIAAYNAKGDVEDSVGNIKESLLNYLQGSMVLGRGELCREHETALARSSMICSKLATATKEAAKKDLYRGRAWDLLDELKQSYPRSNYKAEVEIAAKGVR